MEKPWTKVRGLRGHDAAKQAVEHKRAALVDVEGGWLTVRVVPARIQEHGAFAAERCREWPNLPGMGH